jgi:hypothetical protein
MREELEKEVERLELQEYNLRVALCFVQQELEELRERMKGSTR